MNTIYISNDIEKAKSKILLEYENIVVFEAIDLKLELVKQIKYEAYQTTKTTKTILIKAINLRTESQNALLKLIEESPQKIKLLILTTSKYALLDTIRSRMTIKYINYPVNEIEIKFNPQRLTNKDIYELLKQKFDKNELKLFIYQLLKKIENPSQRILDNLHLAIRLIDLNTDRQAILSLIFLSIRKNNNQ